MKHIKLIFLLLVATAFLACEKTPDTPPVVKMTHEVRSNGTITFVAKAQDRPVIMFHWWIRRNGEIINRTAGASLAGYADQSTPEHGGWRYFDTDEITVKWDKVGDIYTATLEYYDEQYNSYHVSDTDTIK